jgi:hypothetical protein
MGCTGYVLPGTGDMPRYEPLGEFVEGFASVIGTGYECEGCGDEMGKVPCVLVYCGGTCELTWALY